MGPFAGNAVKFSKLLPDPASISKEHKLKQVKLLTFLLAVSIFLSCNRSMSFRKDKAAFEASATTRSFKSVADMNDAYFEIKENGYFDFYRQLFDSVKNSRYPGKFELRNDTMYLHFYDKRGRELLGNKAVVHEKKNEIQFFK